MKKTKSINSLMSYMRTNKGINIQGSTHKQKLRYMGYFHGYKGYRYCRVPHNLLAFTNFDELQSVYDFDMQLKSLLYPKIIFLETTIKNYVLEAVLDFVKSPRFADVYVKALNDYKDYQVESNKYKQAIKKRMDVWNRVYGKISCNYEKNIVKHYYDNEQPVPIWAIFELITLGEFARFLECVNITIRRNISKSIGINSSIDSDGQLTHLIVFVLKDLRNAIAHNGIIFDARFRTAKTSQRIPTLLLSETGIQKITFETIVDYVILITFLLKILKCKKSEAIGFVRNFQKICEDLRSKVPINEYNKIILTDTRNKIKQLIAFI